MNLLRLSFPLSVSLLLRAGAGVEVEAAGAEGFEGVQVVWGQGDGGGFTAQHLDFGNGTRRGRVFVGRTRDAGGVR